MKKSTLYLSLAIISLLIVPISSGLDSDGVTIIPIKNQVIKGEVAIFNITIANKLPIIDDIEFSSPDIVTWDVYTLPRSDYRVNVFPETERNVLLYIKPLYVSVGIYDIRLDIISHRTNEKIRATIPVEVKADSQPVEDYKPFVKASLVMPEEIDPREPLRYSLVMRNLVPVLMNNVRIRIKGALIDQSYTTTLGPKEEKEIEFIANLDPFQSPRKDTVGGEVIYLTENKSFIFEIEKASYSVIAYADFWMEESKVSTFYSSDYSFTVTNRGNIKKSDDVQIDYRFMDWLFASVEPDANTIEVNGDKVHQWKLTLDPGETVELNISRNYLGLYIFIVVSLLIVLFYFLFRSPIILEKTAKKIASQDENLRSLKVRVYIKNRTNKVLEEVKIVDRIPQMIEVDKEFQIGTIKPDKILKHTGRPTKVIWNIPVLESYEERIITYRIRSKLEIVGGLTLPKAYVRFKQENGKQRTTLSRKFVMMG